MAAFVYLAICLACGVLAMQWLLPGQRALYRLWLGLCLGLMAMMWLPALVAFVLRFSVAGHLWALGLLALLMALCWLARDRRTPLRRWGGEDRRDLRLLVVIALPLTLLGAYLQFTHNLRTEGGALYVGQSTYGDLALHTGIITSLRDARFPADYSILPGARLSYPFLADSLSTTFMLLGCSLQVALVAPGTLMMALVFSGYLLLALRMATRRRAAALAALLLFINGGLGFLYSFDMMGVSLGTPGANALQSGTWLQRLRTILDGWYQTPVNHAEFTQYNLRWSNIIADMLIPQRAFLAGWVFLLPCLYLLYDGLRPRQRNVRAFALLGVMAGGLPLIHTHSFLALGLASAGWLVWDLFRRRPLAPWLVYGGVVLVLALPQLVGFTFRQSGAEGFLRVQFNWVNNSGGAGLRDGYLWFWIKNVGLPFVLIVLSLFEKNEKHRFMYTSAFAIFIVAELVLFQPNEYDNNKLFYVWYALCLVPASEYAFTLWDRLRGLRARPLLGVLAGVVFFLSGALSIARECVSNVQAYSPAAVAAARYVEQDTPPHSVFMTSHADHLNPVSALAGRTIVCGPGLWLHWHGFEQELSLRQQEIDRFYRDPQANLPVLQKYGVDYVLLGPSERNLGRVDQAALDSGFTLVYHDAQDTYRIYEVPEG
ncbi:MAG: hypothetical protein GX653_06055 [Clostridiales bacterium]|nr:hypothetical protein [Clostridiales bacterium]